MSGTVVGLPALPDRQASAAEVAKWQDRGRPEVARCAGPAPTKWSLSCGHVWFAHVTGEGCWCGCQNGTNGTVRAVGATS